jgi:hypothetical protein
MALREGGPLPRTAGAPDQGATQIGKPIRRSGPDLEIRWGDHIPNRMIALDLYAEVKLLCINSDQLYGVPYIWQVPFLNIKKQYYFASFFIIEPTQYFLQVHASQFRCRF